MLTIYMKNIYKIYNMCEKVDLVFKKNVSHDTKTIHCVLKNIDMCYPKCKGWKTDKETNTNEKKWKPKNKQLIPVKEKKSRRKWMQKNGKGETQKRNK